MTRDEKRVQYCEEAERGYVDTAVHILGTYQVRPHLSAGSELVRPIRPSGLLVREEADRSSCTVETSLERINFSVAESIAC